MQELQQMSAVVQTIDILQLELPSSSFAIGEEHVLGRILHINE